MRLGRPTYFYDSLTVGSRIYTGFRLVPKSVILSDNEQRYVLMAILCFFCWKSLYHVELAEAKAIHPGDKK